MIFRILTPPLLSRIFPTEHYRALDSPNFLYRYFVFYPATMPAINLPLALLDLILFWKMRLRPAYALTEAILLLCGWAVQVAIWTQCELPAGIGYLGEQSCYQQRLSGSATGDYNGEPEGIPMGLTHAKATFGYLCLML